MFGKRIPIRTIVWLIAGWVFLSLVNIVLKKQGFYEDVPTSFPISVFRGPTIHFTGIPFLLLFFIILWVALKAAPELSAIHVWLIGLSLIIAGNLGQGDWVSAFVKPLVEGGAQYYHDAVKITSWSEWLSSFNIHQHSLFQHARTHPPFAVLTHSLFLSPGGNNVSFLSMMFVILSSTSILILWHLLRILAVPTTNRNLLALLFSVLPAVNIYSAVSLDGLILTGSILFLFGMMLVLQSQRLSLYGMGAMVLGTIFTNLLSYGGFFLFAVAGIAALKEIVVNKKYNAAISFLISTGIFCATLVLLFLVFGYNYLEGFSTAIAFENPDGFRGWQEPLTYAATRIEGICEIALFLSIGFLAMLFHPNRLGISYSDVRDTDNGIVLSGMFVIAAMFVTGAFRTGETARSAIFIYPYFLLALRRTDKEILNAIIVLAGFQTAAMQLFGNYFW